MVEREIAYTVGHEAELDGAVRALGERFPSETERTLRQRLYYDTFDWRLWRRRSRLWMAPASGGSRLIWQSESRPRPLRLELAPELASAGIGFAADLPPGGFRAALAKVIAMRRLLPVVDVRAEGRSIRILDRRRKTVVRLFAELPAARAPGSPEPRKRLDPILIVRPVRGYSSAYREVVAFLGGELALEEWDGDELEAGSALGGFGRAGEYGSGLSVALDRFTDADEALREVLRTLLGAIERNESGTISDVDTEFLHDFRVAVRRTRSALSQTKEVWAPEIIGPFRREFSWLSGITGPTRDLDVYLLELPQYAAALPEPVRGDLEPLRRLLEAKREKEQGELAAELAGSRYRRLIESWRDFLAGPPPAAPRPAAASQPIARLASRVIGKAHRRVLKRGRAIADGSPREALHRLRIDCKKLRYLLEFFRALHPPQKLERPIRALKQLQDNLGAYNDYGVQQLMLRRFGGELGAGGVAAVMALGRLVAELEKGEAKERARFSKRFAEFSSRETTERFRGLLEVEEQA